MNLVEGGTEGVAEGASGPIQHQRNVNQQIKSTNRNNEINFLYMFNILYDNSYRLTVTFNFVGKKCATICKKSSWFSLSSSIAASQTYK